MILTGRSAAAAVAERVGAGVVANDPVEAQGRALAGRPAASLGSAPIGSGGGLAASCVHCVLAGDDVDGGDVAAVFVPGTVQEVADLSVVAHRASLALGAPVSVVLYGGLADRAEELTLPEPEVALTLAGAVDPAPGGLSEVFAVVGAGLGRPYAAVRRSGPDGAARVVVAVGVVAERARLVAAADVAVVSLAQLVPLPAAELAAAVGTAEVVVLDPARSPGSISGPVARALGVDVRAVATIPATVAAALGTWAREPEARDGWSIVAVPGGGWARTALRQVVATLGVGGDLAENTVATTLWVEPIGAGGVRQVVLAAGAAALADGELLSSRALGSTVVVAGRTGQDVARELGAGGRRAARDRELSLWSVSSIEQLGDAAARVVLHGSGAIRVGAERLEESAHAEEIDFGRTEELPSMPGSTGSDAADQQVWRDRVSAFWSGRGTAGDLGSSTGVRPLALDTAAAALTAARPWPVVIEDNDGTVAVTTVVDLVARATDDARSQAAAGRRRGIAARVALDPGQGAVAQRVYAAVLAELDDEAEASRVAAHVPDAAIVPWDEAAPLKVFAAAIAAPHRAARAALAAEASRLEAALGDRIRVDDDATGVSRSAPALGASLGALGAVFDAGVLSASTGPVRGSRALDPGDRAEIEAARATLSAWLETATEAPMAFVHGPGPAPRGVPDQAMRWAHPHPTGAAVGVFDALVADLAPVLSALRRGSELVDGVPFPPIDLDRPDWEALSAAELAAVTPVIVVLDGQSLRDRGAGGLVALVRASRPVRVLVVDTPDDARAGELSRHHLSLGTLAVACREAVVVEGSLARPRALVGGLADLARSHRPGIAVVSAPRGPLGLVRAEAVLRGRGSPNIFYNPDRGDSWADRLDLSHNPQPHRAWPRDLHRLYAGAEIIGVELAFTWADAVALEPAYRDHFAPLPPEAWDDTTQAPLADVLATWRPGEPVERVPWILGVDDIGVVCRVVVSRELTAAALEHGRAWRFVQELAGIDNPLVEAAAANARVEAEAAAEARIEALVAEHAAALDEVREQTARDALGRLASALLAVDTALPVGVPVPAAAVVVAPEPTAAPTPVEAPAAPAVAEDDDDDEIVIGEAWIDSPMCTTCNECTNLNPLLFVYNADKQAIFGDLAAGSFEDLVRAAEKCPAKCIHPGRPRPGDSSASPDVVERAAPFQ